ncbi:hypothetical protein FSP39_002371 [Pinctada imbricata]|uniref:Uncharacterized protein n=1 Tax=Pinctada imbricata TaxID=66713 RepID=A0AA89C0I7_PINIB|nr:hypothetical protein FSP39_002371 [Pinctada imbricata]
MTLNLQYGRVSRYTLPGVRRAGIRIVRNSNRSYARRKSCSYMADFKVKFKRFSDRGKFGKLLRIELEIAKERAGYLINIGDSATNNGWVGFNSISPRGDASTQTNDAEIMGYNNNILVYYSDYCMYQKEVLKNSLANANRAILWVGNEYARIQTKTSAGRVLYDQEYSKHCLFALNMQRDQCSRCRNLDVYVALNNMISGTYRAGYGICKAHFSWERCY